MKFDNPVFLWFVRRFITEKYLNEKKNKLTCRNMKITKSVILNFSKEEDLHLVKVFQAGISPPQSKCVLRGEGGRVAEERRHVWT